MAPGADFTDLRCRPAGRRLEYSESAGHDYIDIDDWALYFLVDCESIPMDDLSQLVFSVAEWFSMAPGADFTDPRS